MTKTLMISLFISTVLEAVATQWVAHPKIFTTNSGKFSKPILVLKNFRMYGTC